MSARFAESTRQAVADALGLAANWSPEDARRSLLAKLADADFAPTPLIREAAAAAGVFCRGQAPMPAFDRAVEEQLSIQVEALAESYWQLSPADREAQWQELTEGCASFPRLVARLRDLDQGLKLKLPTDLADPKQAGLVQLVAELYLLNPGTRASRRHYRLAELGAKQELCETAHLLTESHPELSQIDHGLLEWLIFPQRPVEPVPAVPRPRSVNWTRSGYSSDNRSKENSYRWLWTVLPFCILCCSGLARNASRSPSNTYSNSTPGVYKNSQPYGPSDPANYGKLSLETSDAIAKILSSTRTLQAEFTSAQLDMLRALASRESLSQDDADLLVPSFRTRKWVSETDQPKNEKSRRDWEEFVKTSLTPDQRDVLGRLSRPIHTDLELRLLLIQFVNAGKRGTAGLPLPGGTGSKP
jgi:hypothetical protein